MKSEKKESGQALVEFALVLPLLLLLVFGIIEFGRIFQASLVVSHAAREGARQGVVEDVGRKDRIEDVVEIAGSSIGLDRNVNLTITPSDAVALDALGRGSTLTVSVHANVNLITPIISNILSDDGIYNVESTAVMRVE